MCAASSALAEDGGVFGKEGEKFFHIMPNGSTPAGKGGLGVRGGGASSDDVKGPLAPSEAPKQGVVVMGSLDKEVIRSTVHARLEDYRACASEGASGKVVVKFVISPTGTVSVASVNTSTTKNQSLDECVIRAVRQLKFPPPKGGGVVIVNYPFAFPL
ncbi:MAG: TonB family protein [Archangium sp.]|nr:TonB family protein [Archangium sp.]